jgi:hypothetical protein
VATLLRTASLTAPFEASSAQPQKTSFIVIQDSKYNCGED